MGVSPPALGSAGLGPFFWYGLEVSLFQGQAQWWILSLCRLLDFQWENVLCR